MRALTLAALAVFVLSGCSALITRQGNATYKLICPVLMTMPDGSQQVATYVNEKGERLPVMAELDASSGRTGGGDTLLDVPGCVKVDVKGGLQQGQEASTSVIDGVGDTAKFLLQLIFGK